MNYNKEYATVGVVHRTLDANEYVIVQSAETGEVLYDGVNSGMFVDDDQHGYCWESTVGRMRTYPIETDSGMTLLAIVLMV